MEIENLSHFDSKISKIYFLEAKILPNNELQSITAMGFNFVVVVQRLVVVVVLEMVGELALVVDFSNVMTTSPSKMANCAPPGPPPLWCFNDYSVVAFCQSCSLKCIGRRINGMLDMKTQSAKSESII